MRNIDNLLHTVYDEIEVMGEIRISFNSVEDRWWCRIVGARDMVWLDASGERYLSASDHDLDSAMRELDKLCAGQPVTR